MGGRKAGTHTHTPPERYHQPGHREGSETEPLEEERERKESSAEPWTWAARLSVVIRVGSPPRHAD